MNINKDDKELFLMVKAAFIKETLKSLKMLD